MSSEDELRIYLDELAQALQRNLPPPPIPPDLPVGGESEIDMLVAALGAAASEGDPEDMASAEAGFAKRALKTGEAMARFPENEAQSAQSMQQLMGMAQQLPQQMSGMTQGANGAFGGMFQQLNQMLQQGLQAGQRMAGGMGGASGLGSGPGALGGVAGAGGSLGKLAGAGAGAGTGLGSTVPSGNLGAAGVPSESTRPAVLRQTPVPVEGGAVRGGAMGGGYPMMGPGAAGAGSAAGKDEKTDTKRVMPRAIKNGAPVQGRITATPRLPEVTKRIDGKPVTARRVPPPEGALEPKPDEK